MPFVLCPAKFLEPEYFSLSTFVECLPHAILTMPTVCFFCLCSEGVLEKPGALCKVTQQVLSKCFWPASRAEPGCKGRAADQTLSCGCRTID